MKKTIIFFLFLITLLHPLSAFAQEKSINCSNRYATIVNPIRGRNLWHDKSIKPLQDQYSAVSKHNFPATWLLQYDTFDDQEIQSQIKQFNKNHELGLFLEVSQKLADKSRVVYPINHPWFDPSVIFLSGYTQSERIRLIDTLFYEFNKLYGYYPNSVGAWWIDSFSLSYMQKKYGITSAIIVADQLTTDHYGVWGQWWGAAYFPSKANILTPANSLENKMPVVILQWAQRDPVLAYGDTPKFSNYSLQANDYIRQGKNTEYFKTLVSIYSDCQNPVSQVTVGLETGIESVGYIEEFRNQMDALKEFNSLQIVTMADFAKKYASIYPQFPKEYSIDGWKLTTNERKNDVLGDNYIYKPQIAFSDYFISDENSFLDRRLPPQVNQKDQQAFQLVIFIVVIFMAVFSWYKKQLLIFLASLLFSLGTYGLFLRSFYQYGWKVYFGTVAEPLILYQVASLVIPFIFFYFADKKFKISKYKELIFLIPFTLGINVLISTLRYSVISGVYYFGFLADAFRFIGASFSKPFKSAFINQDFPAYQAVALLKLDYAKIWDNIVLGLLVFPLVFLGLGCLVWYVTTRFLPKRIQLGILGMLGVLYLIWVIMIFQADPRIVLPLN